MTDTKKGSGTFAQHAVTKAVDQILRWGRTRTVAVNGGGHDMEAVLRSVGARVVDYPALVRSYE